MSKLTDAIDAAGDDVIAPRGGEPLRAVVATSVEVADALFLGLVETSEGRVADALHHLSENVSDAPPVRILATDEGATTPSGDARRGGYQGHVVHAEDGAVGRVLLHALRLLEEDPIADLESSAREARIDGALGHAWAAETRGDPFESRLSWEAVDAYLDAEELPPPPASAPVAEGADVPGAAIVFDGLGSAAVVAASSHAVMVARAGRPAIAVVARGDAHDDVAIVAALVRVLVGLVDLSEPLAVSLVRAGEVPVLAAFLDERGQFDTRIRPTDEPIAVRGFEPAT